MVLDIGTIIDSDPIRAKKPICDKNLIFIGSDQVANSSDADTITDTYQFVQCARPKYSNIVYI